MTAFKIYTFENLEFNIPAGGDKSITVTVPPLDCVDPKDLQKINEDAKENPITEAYGMTRRILLYFNTSKAKQDAINKLVERQLKAIDGIWAKESGVTVGESEPSTGTSSESSD